MDVDETLQKAIETFGVEAQIDQTIEEMAELTQALIKRRRMMNAHGACPENVKYNIAEEMADVLIMMEQLLMIFDNYEEVGIWQKEKISRLEAYIEGRPYDNQ